jgi:glycolate oxidase subunit GlcD
MKRILGIEPDNLCVHVEPGLTNMELQEALAGHGYFFAPDPASQQVSTLGGNVSENSGGPHCLKYGVTTNHILGVKLVAPDGEIVELGGKFLDRMGYDLLGLVVGSEGTLGIVTEITCRIMPLPESVKTMLGAFDSTEQAGQAVSDIIAAGILPATLEMMDNTVIRAVEASLHAGYPVDAAAVLIIEIDGTAEVLDDVAVEIERICRSNGARELHTAKNEDERSAFWAGRRGALGAVARLYPNYAVSDGTVPRTKLPEALRNIDEISRKYSLDIGNVLHAGDGNLHPLVFFDSKNKEQVERVHQAGKEILKVCTDLGGTITGEHGVGTEKINAMSFVFGADEIELMRTIKRSLDPLNLCNPGKILPSAAPAKRVTLESPDGTRDNAAAVTQHRREKTTYSPTSPMELSATVRALSDNGQGFGIFGAQTLSPFLPLKAGPDVYIETRNMRDVVEHDALNLTATAQAGLSIGELQNSLFEAAQFLPVDAPSEATLGGIVASGLSGPRRHFYGSPRDLVLGLKFVGADGTLFRAGGKTVKNVAGYDFGKLLIGSWGKLGIISEITFRLVPLPRMRAAVFAGFEDIKNACDAALLAVSKLNPAMATIVSEQASAWLGKELMPAGLPDRFMLILGAEGFARAVKKQIAGFEHICEKMEGEVSAHVESDDYGSLIDSVTRLSYGLHDTSHFLNVCIGAPAGEAAGLLIRGKELGVQHKIGFSAVAHIASGSNYLQFSLNGSACIRKNANMIVETIRDYSPDIHAIVLGACQDSAGSVPFMVADRAPTSWLTSIKNCLDPQGLLNPAIPDWE